MNMRLFILSVITVLMLAACNKAKYETGMAYGGLSFYNASFALDAFLPATAGSQKKIWLPLTMEGKPSSALTGRGMPFFSQDISGARMDYPAVNMNNQVPWTVFDHYAPGTYSGNVHLNSLDSTSQFNFPVVVEKDQQRAYLLSDSLGAFSVTTVVPDQGVAAGRIRLRLVQLCPDADSVNMRIGNNLVKGLQNMNYRSSAFIDYPLKGDSTLKLRLFNAGDTVNVIGRNDLPAQSGQSYMLVFRNYRKGHQYTDKNGKQVNIISNSTLDLRKVE
jgi:hypothetical protein